ncbi:katanin p80 WD40 repeat-containing subunit B1 homolog KTN80.4 isoform X1 [Cryptomeria japonica]|uniref:katanin p80 WD40 repeat-containing subunit B1 homolog KTN80.4 isoform X1 n=1 Tax=Cryptomeria japonica TaxID=3369 RepID=UPI0027DA5B45|nr:katanin p80 WD40 repeat-containing subunit B1 homolog KTN80.4 isoform X1 [Cryptomeria japonica]
MKRAYKLQEFVAHASNVNCLKIGKKTSRILVTGGEDHKVNMWAIGKPNALLSLSGHTSAVESVAFDSQEDLLVAGAASGTIKLWDLEEGKIVRTLTGHRSNCISVDFHPFGEFFASGSLDTNLKIWDIRRKGCIHTYKGHTRGVNSIKFSPDGRWVVSGGEDNIVKLWDLTAGKLMHDFKCHEGQIQCMDFHPQEFLLATGSADRTVKFWDLETFELIGSTAPETTGPRSMIFNPDGRTLLCGLHESLKTFSWEPLICYDAVDVGWSKLADLSIHKEKLLGCSYNQSCVGVWVVDISRVEPYAAANVSTTNIRNEGKLNSSSNHQYAQQSDRNLKTSATRLSSAQSSEAGNKESKNAVSVTGAECPPNSSPQAGITFATKNHSANSGPSYVSTPKKNNVSRVQPVTSFHTSLGKADVAPVIVPRNSTKTEMAADSKKETNTLGKADVTPAIVPRNNARVETAADSKKETNTFGRADVVPVIVPRNSARVETAADTKKETNTLGRADVVPVIVPRNSARVETTADSKKEMNTSDRADVAPVIVPRNSERPETSPYSRKEPNNVGRMASNMGSSKSVDLLKFGSSRDEADKIDPNDQFQLACQKSTLGNEKTDKNFGRSDQNFTSRLDSASTNSTAISVGNPVGPRWIGSAKFRRNSFMESLDFPHDGISLHSRPAPDDGSLTQAVQQTAAAELSKRVVEPGRARAIAASWERRQRANTTDAPVLLSNFSTPAVGPDMNSFIPRGSYGASEQDCSVGDDSGAIEDLMQQHNAFMGILHTRLTKLQVILRFWRRSDLKGAIEALGKMGDNSVLTDVISVLIERSDVFTLDICTVLLPLLSRLLESEIDRHLSVALEALVMLVKTFGHVIRATIVASPTIGVDIQAEQRLERCKLCSIELEKVKQILGPLSRKGGAIAKSSQELSVALQEV